MEMIAPAIFWLKRRIEGSIRIRKFVRKGRLSLPYSSLFHFHPVFRFRTRKMRTKMNLIAHEADNQHHQGNPIRPLSVGVNQQRGDEEIVKEEGDAKHRQQAPGVEYRLPINGHAFRSLG